MSDSNEKIAIYIESALRIGIIALLLIWSFTIIKPFISLIVWGAIIAVAVYPLFIKFKAKLNGNNKLSSILFTIIALAVLITPSFMLANSAVDAAKNINEQADKGTLVIPPPEDNVKEWPVIGEQVYVIWKDASINLESALVRHKDVIEPIKQKMIDTATGAGVSILMFLVSIIISGVFLANAKACTQSVDRLCKRLVGDGGAEFAQLSGKIVMSVTQGVLGVAFIQAVCAGLVMMIAGIPAAGLWAIVVLILSTIQLGPGLVVIGTVAWAFNNMDTVPAVIYTIAIVIVGLMDNVLKPMLMGRGVKVPMLVIFLGAIGGFMSTGIVGLFVGAVILVITYELFTLWLNKHQLSDDEESIQE
ncbi:AI-2E family transporter [Echinimonas agarilytica]|uniref:AI-2E family transporter n=1 Tax=Echinimonas agarilytica TaxID=1215918 RepID=A0AA41W3B9_9GAMM|nr:AI-2E family transporter [Echinimonas agarilytica]MCM2678092.1 AI-2E family transporter [Echinimonas agarilytica]